MSLPRTLRPWSFSLGLHAAATLFTFGLTRLVPHAAPTVAPVPATVEFQFERPEPIAPPPPPAAPAPTDLPAPTEALHARVLRRTTQSPLPPTPTPVVEPVGTIGPAPTQPTPSLPPTPPIHVANILRQGDALMTAMAAEGPAVPTANAVGAGSARDIFGRRGERPSIGEIASAPTREALAAGEHTNPAGTMRYDRELARRAEEMFMPVRTIPNLGLAVQAAETVGLSAIDRAVPEGETAAGGALDAVHSQAYTTVQMRNMAPPSFHLVRADVEVVQAPNGDVRSATVVRRSGVHGFDEQALNAIRDAVPEVGAHAVSAARRTRWAFEVSNAQSAASQLVGGGNDGWTVMREESNGVRLRMRVRRLSVILLPGG